MTRWQFQYPDCIPFIITLDIYLEMWGTKFYTRDFYDLKIHCLNAGGTITKLEG